MNAAPPQRRALWLAVLLLLVQPLLWLWPCTFGPRTFVPYDLAEYPPASLLLPQEQVAALRQDANHDVTEVPIWVLPELELASRELRAGRLPSWDPHARSGAVLFSNGALGLAYPPTWLALAAEHPASRLGWLAWLQLAIAGLGAFGLLRTWQLGALAAWFGATVFQLGAPMAANAFWWMRLGSLVWLPTLLWALHRLAHGERTRPGPLAAVAAATALPWLAGFPPYALASLVLAGWYSVRLCAERCGVDGLAAGRRLALRLGAGLGLGLLLAMPQLLPALQFFPDSARTPTPPFASIAATAFDRYGLLGYLMPDALSHPAASHLLPYSKLPLAYLWTGLEVDGRRLEPNYNYTEYSVYCGLLPLLLAAYGALRGRAHGRWFALATLVLLLALALFLPGVRWLCWLPGLGNVAPMRWLAPASLWCAWLAALGLERLQTRPAGSWVRLAGVLCLLAAGLYWGTGRPAAQRQRDPDWPYAAIAAKYTAPERGIAIDAAGARAHLQAGAPPGVDRSLLAVERFAAQGATQALWLCAHGAGLLALAFLRQRQPKLATALLPVLLCSAVADLAAHGQGLLRGAERTVPTHTAVHEFLRNQAASATAEGGFAVVRGSTSPTLPSQLPPGQLLHPGLRDLHFYCHYDARSSALLRALLGPEFGHLDTSKGYLTTTLPDAVLTHPLLDLLGVRYVLGTEPLAHAGRRVGPELRGPGGEFYVHERPQPAPRAFVVPELVVLADDDAVLQALASRDFAPRRQAYVTAAAAAAGGLAAHRVDPGAARAVRFVVDTPNRVELTVEPGRAPWLVLADTWLPGWSATVDSAPAAIHCVDHALRLIELPELPDRACHVVCTYTPPGLTLGSWLCAGAALALCLWWFATRR
jgi:hypothetical protein